MKHLLHGLWRRLVRRPSWLLALALLLAGATPAHAATFRIVVTDDANEGFNDPTPFTPVGGNNASTLGGARLNVLKEAARLWGTKLGSDTEIVITASFDTLGCGQYLAQAGPSYFIYDDQTALFYPLSLQSARTKVDQTTGDNPDITATFNTSYGTSTGCQGYGRFYYGLDHKLSASANLDLLSTTSHELGHGLGFISLVDETTGKSVASNGALAIFDTLLFDEKTGHTWDQDSTAERQSAIVSDTGLTWSGTHADTAAATYLSAGRNTAGRVLMYAPSQVQVGSSISHWDKRATPNLLLEPVYTGDQVNLDITPCAMADIGWSLLVNNCRDGAVTNQAPVAQSQSVRVRQNTARGIVLTASDAESDPLTYAVVQAPAHGTLSGTAPNLTYTPATDYLGADSFTFTAKDASATSNTATVSITVAANQAPVAAAQSVSTKTNVARAVTLSATDADNDSLTYSVVAPPAHGTLSGTAPNLTYTPATDYTGQDSFTFKANDGQADSNTATVAIGVSANAPPEAASQSVNTNEDTAVAITLKATDADGDPLTYTVVAQPAHGALTGTAPNLTYTPAANYNGSDSFTFKANDGKADSSTATVGITVAAVNDPPVAASQTVNTSEDTAVAITLSASDPDGPGLSYTVNGGPAHGALTGTAPNLTYTPTANYNGSDSFTFTASDGQSTSNVATVSIGIAAVNDPPVASNQSVATTKGKAVAVALTASDVDGDALTYTVASSPSHGTLAGAAPNLTYTPTAGYAGADSFTFTASDGQATSNVATVSITVSNQAPISSSQSVATAPGQPVAIVLAGSDPDGDAITFAVLAQPTLGTLTGTAPNLTYTPSTTGTDSFTYQVTDSAGAQSGVQTVTITTATPGVAPTPDHGGGAVPPAMLLALAGLGLARRRRPRWRPLRRN